VHGEEAGFSHMHSPVLRPGALDGAQQVRFPHKFVEQTSSSDQFCRSIEFRDFPMIKYDYAIGVQDGVNAVRDGDDGSVFEHVAP
jgi:hypothetical protein